MKTLSKIILAILIVALIGVLIHYGKRALDKQAQQENTDSDQIELATLLVPELGIHISAPKDADYMLVENDPDAVFLGAESLTALGGESCDTGIGPMGILIKRWKANFREDDNLPWWENEEEMKKAVVRGDAKEFIDFYLAYIGPQTPCSEKEDVRLLQNKLVQVMRDNLQSADILYGK